MVGDFTQRAPGGRWKSPKDYPENIGSLLSNPRWVGRLWSSGVGEGTEGGHTEDRQRRKAERNQGSWCIVVYRFVNFLYVDRSVTREETGHCTQRDCVDTGHHLSHDPHHLLEDPRHDPFSPELREEKRGRWAETYWGYPIPCFPSVFAVLESQEIKEECDCPTGKLLGVPPPDPTPADRPVRLGLGSQERYNPRRLVVNDSWITREP